MNIDGMGYAEQMRSPPFSSGHRFLSVPREGHGVLNFPPSRRSRLLHEGGSCPSRRRRRRANPPRRRATSATHCRGRYRDHHRLANRLPTEDSRPDIYPAHRPSVSWRSTESPPVSPSTFPPCFVRSWSIIGCDSSIPKTEIPRSVRERRCGLSRSRTPAPGRYRPAGQGG
jgi:hypothetical protein